MTKQRGRARMDANTTHKKRGETKQHDETLGNQLRSHLENRRGTLGKERG
jgi:hypothetical protein